MKRNEEHQCLSNESEAETVKRSGAALPEGHLFWLMLAPCCFLISPVLSLLMLFSQGRAKVGFV